MVEGKILELARSIETSTDFTYTARHATYLGGLLSRCDVCVLAPWRNTLVDHYHGSEEHKSKPDMMKQISETTLFAVS